MCLIVKGMYLSNFCLLCYGDGESVDHILIHCLFAMEVWNAVIQDFGLIWVMSDVPSLLSKWRTAALNSLGKKLWSMVPTAVGWLLWKERNNRVF